MSFTLPDLVIEGAVRKGFDFLRLNAGISPTDFMDIADVSQINALVGEVYPSNLVLSGATITGTMRFPNVLSFFEDGNVIEFTRAGSLNFRVGDGVTARSDLIQGTTGLDVFIIGTLTFTGTPTLSNGFLQIPFSIVVTGGSNSPPATAASEYATFANVLSPLGATIVWAIPGSRSGTEILGAGGEVLDMLFDFRTGSNSIDGGLDGSVSIKYDQEPFRLREFFRNNEIAIIQSFSDVQTNLPCISIQLASDGEDQGLALTDDFGGIDGFDTTGPIGRDENTIHANTVINVGIHTKEQLLTKYLYHITKYFILSAKEDLIRQNFIIATFRGSDFTRDAAWQGDHVYTRFLNISGKTEDSWVNLDEIVASLDNVNLSAFVGPSATNVSTTSSLLVQGASVGSTTLQLGRSFYLNQPGTAEVVTYNGRGIVQTTSSISWDGSGNNELTNILTLNTPLTVEHQVILSDDPLIARTTEVILPNGTSFFVATDIDGNVIGTYPGTIQNPPNNLLQSTPQQEINDADDVLHRSNYTIP